MHISSNFDGGNIRVQSIDGLSASLEICPDPDTEYLHWFCFRSIAEAGSRRIFRITNASKSRTKEGWEGYRAVASYDGEEWFRIPTRFDGETLTFEIEPEFPSVYFAHFARYTQERHDELISWCQSQPDVGLEVIGNSIEGRPLEMLKVGLAPRRFACWITSGQHPGEPMGKWFVEGVLERLLDEQDPISLLLRQHANFYIVPTVNPDGSFAGRLRTNAASVDLNRAWKTPDLKSSPEIFHLRNKMEQTGIDFYLDVHGDETIPYCFFVNADPVPSMTPELVKLRESFESAFQLANPDFQREHGYPPEKNAGDLSIANNWVAEQYKCLSLTLEQPFKDLADSPTTKWGWSPERCANLGASTLEALASVIHILR